MSDRAVQYVPPAPAARRRGRQGSGRAPQNDGLGRPHPDGLRRLPGILPGGTAEDQRGGRDLCLPSGWPPYFHGAGGVHADPVQPGQRHRHGL